MAKLRFSEPALARPGPGTNWDQKLAGFGLVVRAPSERNPQGTATYMVQYRPRGSGRYGPTGKLSLGRTPPLSLPKARREAEKILADVAKGEDPARLRKLQAGSPTVRSLAERFEAEHLPNLAEPTATEYRRQLRRHILPTLGGLLVADVSARDVASLLHGLREKPVLANRVRALLSSLFSEAERWGLRELGTNPGRPARKHHVRRSS